MSIELTRLPNGTRVVSQRLPEARSQAVAYWFEAGSRDEPAHAAGALHAVEHLAFKGAGVRDSVQLAGLIDRLGGQLDAFTSKEHVVFHGRVLAGDSGRLIELLSDLVRRPWLRPADLERERSVIVEEMAMYEDAPEESAHTLLEAALWPTHPLGREIAGTRTSVGQLTSEQIEDVYRRSLTPANLVVSGSGPLTHAQLVAQIEDRLGDWATAPQLPPRESPRAEGGCLWRPRHDLEQLHLILGGEGLKADDRDRYAEELLLLWLGGGSSSLLFQEVRERRGLVYAIYAFASAYQDAGSRGIYLATSPANGLEALQAVHEVLQAAAHGPDEAACQELKAQFESSFWLGLETTGAQAQRLGHDLLTYGEVESAEAIVAAVRAVTPAQIRALAERWAAAATSLVAVGTLPAPLRRAYPWVTVHKERSA